MWHGGQRYWRVWTYNRQGVAVKVHTLPRLSATQTVFVSTARDGVEYKAPSCAVARTRERQLARALVFASHSSFEGSPRAEIGVVAHTRAEAGGTAIVMTNTVAIANNAAVLVIDGSS